MGSHGSSGLDAIAFSKDKSHPRKEISQKIRKLSKATHAMYSRGFKSRPDHQPGSENNWTLENVVGCQLINKVVGYCL